MAVNALRANITSTRIELMSLHYASPRPLAKREILRRGERLAASLKVAAFDGIKKLSASRLA